jgi:hypothetical protein
MSKPIRPTTRPSLNVSPSPALNRRPPVAPPVYRPQPPTKVLQTKAANVAPPAYRPQPKSAPQAPPVYRPQPVPGSLQKKEFTASAPAGGRAAPSALPLRKPANIPQASQKHSDNRPQVTPRLPARPVHARGNPITPLASGGLVKAASNRPALQLKAAHQRASAPSSCPNSHARTPNTGAHPAHKPHVVRAGAALRPSVIQRVRGAKELLEIHNKMMKSDEYADLIKAAEEDGGQEIHLAFADDKLGTRADISENIIYIDRPAGLRRESKMADDLLFELLNLADRDLRRMVAENDSLSETLAEGAVKREWEHLPQLIELRQGVSYASGMSISDSFKEVFGTSKPSLEQWIEFSNKSGHMDKTMG